MIHVLYFISRKAALEPAEFHRYWREVHGPIAARIPQLRRYVQSHREYSLPGNAPFDGAAEVWLEDEAALAELRREPAYLEGALADEPNFIDMQRVQWLMTTDHVVLDGAIAPTMVKGTIVVRRKFGTTRDDFRRYWEDVHAPIVRDQPGLRRYVQCRTLDAAYNYSDPRWDGVAQVWFDSAAAVRAASESAFERARLLPDVAKFVDERWVYYTNDALIKGAW